MRISKSPHDLSPRRDRGEQGVRIERSRRICGPSCSPRSEAAPSSMAVGRKEIQWRPRQRDWPATGTPPPDAASRTAPMPLPNRRPMPCVDHQPVCRCRRPGAGCGAMQCHRPRPRASAPTHSCRRRRSACCPTVNIARAERLARRARSPQRRRVSRSRLRRRTRPSALALRAAQRRRAGRRDQRAGPRRPTGAQGLGR